MAECVRQGLLKVDGDLVSFHHALTRQAIESALTETDRQDINARVLAALGDGADPSRLVHHAREANDATAIVAFAPVAARNAIAIESHREDTPGVMDQDLNGFVIAEDGEPVGRITDGDSVIMFNFRGDRAIEISQAFEQDQFDAFDRGSFFPRLIDPATGNEPRRCQVCEVKEACIRGDSGARRRLEHWVADAKPGSDDERALLNLWRLGES